jgi:hypothetical protein
MRKMIFTLLIIPALLFGQYDTNWSTTYLDDYDMRVQFQVEYDSILDPPDSIDFYADGYMFGRSYYVEDQNKYVDYWIEQPPGGVYYVQAKMYASGNEYLSVGQHLSYSSQIEDTLGRLFTTQLPFPARVVLEEPEHNATDVSVNVVLRWQETPFADYYRLQVGRGSGSDAFINPIVDVVLEDPIYQLSGLEYNAQYRWRVRAGNVTGWGEWSGE